MSNQHLPEELLDLIVDLLHDERRTLRKCCLVSKSWIPRARKHLFANIELYGAKALQSWKTAFPDPSTSPACYVRILIAVCLPEIVTAGAEEGGCISTFTNVLDFGMVAPETDPGESPISLLPFYGFSPGLKTLCLAFPVVPPPQLFNLICSFPLLDDLRSLSVFVSTRRSPLPKTASHAEPRERCCACDGVGRGVSLYPRITRD